MVLVSYSSLLIPQLQLNRPQVPSQNITWVSLIESLLPTLDLPCLHCSQRSYFPRSHNGWSNSENSRPFQPKVPKSFHCVPQSNIVRSVTVIFHKPGVAALEGNPQTSIWGRRWHQHHSREANPCWHDNPLTARFSERNRHRQGPWIWLISSQTCWNLLHTLWKCTQPSKAEIK